MPNKIITCMEHVSSPDIEYIAAQTLKTEMRKIRKALKNAIVSRDTWKNRARARQEEYKREIAELKIDNRNLENDNKRLQNKTKELKLKIKELKKGKRNDTYNN